MLTWRHGLTVGLVLLLGLLVTGCPTPPSGSGSGKGTGAKEEEGEPPHGGKLFAPEGNKHPFHVELKYGKDEKPTMYLLDEHVKKPVSTKDEEVTLTIAGTPPKSVTFKADDKDAKGQSSKFVAAEPLPADLDLEKVTINVKYDGKPFVLKLDKD